MFKYETHTKLLNQNQEGVGEPAGSPWRKAGRRSLENRGFPKNSGGNLIRKSIDRENWHRTSLWPTMDAPCSAFPQNLASISVRRRYWSMYRGRASFSTSHPSSLSHRV